jgi:fatty acid synthase subunit alpha
MGLIQYHNGALKGVQHCGWLDKQSGNPITDCEVKVKYEEYILNHTGLRFWELRDDEPTDVSQQSLLHKVHVTEDLAPLEVTLETANDLQRQHGDKVDIFDRDGEMFARLKAGATLMILKDAKLDVGVGGQVPKSWNASVYGISDEIISEVDPVTLWTLVPTIEALLSAGITDFYELYQHINVSEVAICIGAGMGAAESIRKMWKGRYLDEPVQKDILAESFINTTGAWVNMLLMGASCPMRTPVDACATALESVDTGYDLITTGKAQVCLVGGFDALQLETAAEFRNMQATVNATQEVAAGREPREMSRPMTSSPEDSGVQIMTTARLALDMGLPIHGIVALSHTASDKIRRSVPAPGEGLLTAVAEAPSKFLSPMLKTAYRRRNIMSTTSQIKEKRAESLNWLNENANSYDMGSVNSMRSEIEMEAKRAQKEVLRTYGNRFWENDDRISPLRGALAVWGLAVDDIDFASLHGTSTVKNDVNETNVLQQQNAQLGRAQGNLLPCVCQKWLTGHGKGAAGKLRFQFYSSRVN